MHSRAIFSFCTRDPPFVLASIHHPHDPHGKGKITMFGFLPMRISCLPTGTRNCTKKTGREKEEDLDLFRFPRPLGADCRISYAGAPPWSRCCGQLCRHKRERRGALAAAGLRGNPFPREILSKIALPRTPAISFFVFDLFPVVPRSFGIACLQLPSPAPSRSLLFFFSFFFIFFFLPGGVLAAPNCPALLWSSNAGGPEASESTICVLMSYFMCQQ